MKEVAHNLGRCAIVDTGCVGAYMVVGQRTLDNMGKDMCNQRIIREFPCSGVTYLFVGGSATKLRTVEFRV